MPYKAADLLPRFWSKVLLCQQSRECPTCCHSWIGDRNRTNYGILPLASSVRQLHGIKTRLAHRIAWHIHHGPIPATQHVCHSCDNPPCVNVQHLWLGDARTNQQDAALKGRKPAGALHPLRQHPEKARNGSRRYPERLPHGEANTQSKLTAAMVQRIRQQSREGWTQTQIAQAAGVSKGCIQFILSGKTWKHLP